MQREGSKHPIARSCRVLRGITSHLRESTARTSQKSDADVVASASQCIALPLVTAFPRFVWVEVTGCLSHVSHVKKSHRQNTKELSTDLPCVPSARYRRRHQGASTRKVHILIETETFKFTLDLTKSASTNSSAATKVHGPMALLVVTLAP